MMLGNEENTDCFCDVMTMKTVCGRFGCGCK
jgi:hypothetical protein